MVEEFASAYIYVGPEDALFIEGMVWKSHTMDGWCPGQPAAQGHHAASL